MEKPTLEEVKEYFKNVEFVETTTFKQKRKVDLDSAFVDEDGDIMNTEKETGYHFFLWEGDSGYAKILTTKKPTYSITADQLMQLENGFTLPKLKEWFPEVFETKLKVGKWYKSKKKRFPNLLVMVVSIQGDEFTAYGIDNDKKWLDTESGWSLEDPVEATEQEVFEALKNEAVKRGFIDEGNMFEGMEDSTFLYKCKGVFEIIPQEELVDSMKGKTVMQLNRKDIFQNGKWAEIIPTITKSEAEKLLNKKIID